MGEIKKIIIAGNPNVGKSVIFNALTGSYATVSNYPGTTVEVFRGKTKAGGEDFEVVDTPGMYSFVPVTEEERVSRNIILAEKPVLVIHVIDTKNIERMLPFTIQLIEARLPVILVLNIMDEADRLGLKLNIKLLEEQLGIPVVSSIGTMGKGITAIREKITGYAALEASTLKIVYDPAIEKFINDSGLDRLRALLVLQDDTEIINTLKKEKKTVFKELEPKIEKLREKYAQPLSYLIALARQQSATGIVEEAKEKKEKPAGNFTEKLSRLTMNTFSGYILLAAVLYFGLYLFVGKFGAGFLVDLMEKKVFGEWLIPPAAKFIENIFPWKAVQDIFINDYGIVTLGMRYAFAIILPIVGTFFFVFAIIEDTGYLPHRQLRKT